MNKINVDSPKALPKLRLEKTISNIDTYLFNPKNKLLNANNVNDIFRKAGIAVKCKNIQYYQNAQVHKSYAIPHNLHILDNYPDLKRPDGCIDLQPRSYERLELLGDGVLDLISTKYLMERYPNENEGFITKTKTKIVCTGTLARIAEQLGLPEFLIISRNVEDNCAGRSNPRILEDFFEAFLGAMELDFNSFDICMKFVVFLFENYLDIPNLVAHDDNYKAQLLEYFQHSFNGLFPVYQEIAIEGPPNGRTYTMGVTSPDGEIIGIGVGNNKKLAEQLASKNALIFYKILQ